MDSFLNSKSNYIEKFNVEVKESVRKGSMRCSLLRLSAVFKWWYDVGYDIQNLLCMLRNLDIFWQSVSCEVCMSFIVVKRCTKNRVFPLFNFTSIVTYVINTRWHLILSRWSNLVDSIQNIKFFWTARLTA